jgi:ABC-2 type transport system ATP-binding protein
MLEVHDVAFRYGTKTVLTNVRLSFGVGATVLLGRNGAGKTTLMRILAGAAAPSVGEVRLNGKPSDPRTRTGRQALRDIGWLPQEFGFPSRMTAAEFVAYAAWLKEVPRQRIVDRVRSALSLVDLSEQAEKPLRSLSGGQLRRLGLAAAVAPEPEVLILDEPTAGLDPEQRDSFHGFIRRLRGEKTVVVATHLLEDVEALAEHIVVIDSGSVRWTGTPSELAEKAGKPGISGLRHGFQLVIDGGR